MAPKRAMTNLSEKAMISRSSVDLASKQNSSPSIFRIKRHLLGLAKGYKFRSTLSTLRIREISNNSRLRTASVRTKTPLALYSYLDFGLHIHFGGISDLSRWPLSSQASTPTGLVVGPTTLASFELRGWYGRVNVRFKNSWITVPWSLLSDRSFLRVRGECE